MYADYEETIRSVANGKSPNSDVVGMDQLLGFMQTSGSTRGHIKLIPRTEADKASRDLIRRTLYSIQAKAGMHAERTVVVLHKTKIENTPSGLPRGGGTSFAFVDPRFRTLFEKQAVIPFEIHLLDCPHRVILYAILLAALLKREKVESIAANFANQILEMFSILEDHWQTIMDHLRSGPSLFDGLVDRKSLAILQPLVGTGRSDLAEAVATECKAGFTGIIPRLFPNCSAISCVTTGSLKPYAEKLKVLAGDIPLVSGAYVSTEAEIGVNTDPLQRKSVTPLYTLAPRNAVFEFLPVGGDTGEVANTATLDRVRVGGCYEVIVTARTGLFRYRLGDIVRVAGMEQATPVIEFLYRSGAVISLHSERMTERQLQDAFLHANSDCGMGIIEFVFDGDRSMPPSYVCYVEVKKETTASELVNFATALDRSLADENGYYRLKRSEGLLGCVKLLLVENGCFSRYAECMAERGADLSQFKLPHCIVSERHREHLQNACQASYESQAFADGA